MADIEDVANVANNLRENRVATKEIQREQDSGNRVIQPASTRTTVPRSGHDIPGDATVYVHTFGCGHNVSDGEYMSGQLFKNGYRITDEFGAADCYLINSCTVKNPSEDHFVTLVRRAKATKKPVIVAGCVPAGEPNGSEWQDVSVIGVRQIHRVTEVVQEAMRGNTIRLFDTEPAAGRRNGARLTKGSSRSTNIGKNKKSNNNSISNVKHNEHADADDDDQDDHEDGHDDQNDDHKTESEKEGQEQGESSSKTSNKAKLPSLLLPKVRRNKFIEIVPINVGCLNTCTYCKTKHARGDLQSWPVAEIAQRVKDSVAEGVREIYLTSEDTGAYGIDLGTDIVVLLREILKVLDPTDVMLRLGMTNPPYLIRHLDAIGPLFRHKNFYEFAHIPVQSGSDAVLEIMKREYTVDEFKLCVAKLREASQKMTIATDIICAFPFEGEKEWRETMDLCREVQFPVLNISRFYPRRGTPAAAMKQVPTEVAKKRTQEISNLFNNQSSIDGSNVDVGDAATMWLVEVAHDKHHLVGHTKQFVQVLVDPSEASLGDLVRVKITEVLRFCAKASVEKILVKDSDYVAGLTKLKSSNSACGNLSGNNGNKAVVEDTYGGNDDDEEDDTDGGEDENAVTESCCAGSGCCSSTDPVANKESQSCCASNKSNNSNNSNNNKNINNNNNISTSSTGNGEAVASLASSSCCSLTSTSRDAPRERIVLSDKNLKDDRDLHDDAGSKTIFWNVSASLNSKWLAVAGGVVVASAAVITGIFLWKRNKT